MANIDDTGSTQPITDVPISTEPTTTVSTQPTGTEPSTTVGTSPGTAAATNNADGKEKFDYEEVKKTMEALDGEFKKFAETLKKANDLINESINVSYESAVYSKSGDGVGAKFLKQWNDNASTFGDFYNNFEGWSKLVTLISSNNAEFEVTARTTGATMDGVSSLVAGALTAVPTEPSGTGVDEVSLFISNHGLINTGAAWMTAFMALAPESQSKINGMIRTATDEAEKYIKEYGLVNNGTAYNNLDKAVRDIIDKRIKENEENSTNGLTETPTEALTSAPTEAPTSAPTEAPTSVSTEAPTSAPTEAPTSALTNPPTNPSTSAPTTPVTTPDTISEEYRYNQDGWDVNGYHKDTGTKYDLNGYDMNGYDVNGFDVNGYDVNGYDVNGFDANGFDVNGLNSAGFNRAGENPSGIVTGKTGDNVLINGTHYSVYGYVHDTSGKIITIYAGSDKKLYYMDESGKLANVKGFKSLSETGGKKSGDYWHADTSTIDATSKSTNFHTYYGSLQIGNIRVDTLDEIATSARLENSNVDAGVVYLGYSTE